MEFTKKEKKDLNLFVQDYVSNEIKFDIDICYLSIHGSLMYGMGNENSDIDIWGIYIPYICVGMPQNYLYGFDHLPVLSQREILLDNVDYNGKKLDIHIFNINTFVNFCSLGRFNRIELLYTSPHKHHIYCDNYGSQLIKIRHMFINKMLINRMYLFSKFKMKKFIIELKSLEEKFEYTDIFDELDPKKIKEFYHSFRMLYQLSDLLHFGYFTFENKERNNIVKQIRYGKNPFDKKVSETYEDILSNLEEKFSNSLIEEKVQDYENTKEKVRPHLLKILNEKYQKGKK